VAAVLVCVSRPALAEDAVGATKSRINPRLVTAGAVATAGVGAAGTTFALARRDSKKDLLMAAKWARKILDPSQRRSKDLSRLKSSEALSSSSTFLLKPSNEVEKAIVAALDGENVRVLSEAVNRTCSNKAEARKIFEHFGSSQVSAVVDRVAQNIHSDDFTALASLSVLAAMLARLGELGQRVFNAPTTLKYNGTSLDEPSKEQLYRRYTVFSLSSEQRLIEDMDSLRTLRAFLDIPPGRAREMDVEMAKAMFQVAVSAVMHEGVMNEEKNMELMRLQEKFSGVLDRDVAETIMSEVSLMRVLHELQKLLQEQDVSPDVSEHVAHILRVGPTAAHVFGSMCVVSEATEAPEDESGAGRERRGGAAKRR